MAIETYEFHVYGTTDAAESEVPMEPKVIERHSCWDAGAAKHIARKLAQAARGPVDVAKAGPSPWADRYLGTASPTWPGTPSKATTFERLD